MDQMSHDTTQPESPPAKPKAAAAKRFGVKQQTLSDRLKKLAGTTTGSGDVATQSESLPATPKVAAAKRFGVDFPL